MTAGSFHDTDTATFTAEDFRFTTKRNLLYAIELGWPSHGEAVIRSLASGVLGARNVRSVELLGTDAGLPFQSPPDGLHIHLPAAAPGKYAYTYRITFEGTPQ